MEKEMICIICPKSCKVKISYDENKEILSVTGNSCNKGLAYVKEEWTNPQRMVTGTIVIHNAIQKRLPFILSGKIPKEACLSVMEAMRQVEVDAPVQMGQILATNVADLSVDALASRSMERIE